MTGHELRRARVQLGQLWGLDRAAHAAELGRALRLCPSDPGQSVRDYEAHRDEVVPGYLSAGVDMLLRGALPPDGLAAVIVKRKA
jgi:hypothetical protein